MKYYNNNFPHSRRPWKCSADGGGGGEKKKIKTHLGSNPSEFLYKAICSVAKRVAWTYIVAGPLQSDDLYSAKSVPFKPLCTATGRGALPVAARSRRLHQPTRIANGRRRDVASRLRFSFFVFFFAPYEYFIRLPSFRISDAKPDNGPYG